MPQRTAQTGALERARDRTRTVLRLRHESSAFVGGVVALRSVHCATGRRAPCTGLTHTQKAAGVWAPEREPAAPARARSEPKRARAVRRRAEAREGKRRRFADDIKTGSGVGWGATDHQRLKLSVGEHRLKDCCT